MKKSIGSLKEIIYYGLESINEKEMIEISLKDFILTYRTIEEIRRFFHNDSHYPNIETINEYIGDKDSGMNNIINDIYLNVLDKSINPKIEKILESDELNCNLIPFYFNYKKE